MRSVSSSSLMTGSTSNAGRPVASRTGRALPTSGSCTEAATSRSSSKRPAAPPPHSNSNTRTGSGRPAPFTGEATHRATSNDGSPNNSDNRKLPDGSTAGNFFFSHVHTHVCARVGVHMHTPPGARGTPNCERIVKGALLSKKPLYKKKHRFL